ncbi:branched-chain amino acid ABC transporter permease [Halomicroarcula sp. F13]|uniref:Branched-chain amino acid ABC transporter permease n=1 Tax=Haloarcula rubra TaxID=2487747 RepID=A0AAW4PSL3_9EURY|nr:branched-chain amino acid ABC transporter permease [Halomicroarcula rubra]MBX0324124.1 branched-chain amino acid ABC transporter permease [Halomicroarcula rubra]
MSDEPSDATAAAEISEEAGLDGRLEAIQDSELAVVGIAVVGVLLFPLVFNNLLNGYTQLATLVLVWGIFALGFDILLGYTGLLSFGHALFWGGAAYAAGIFSASVSGQPVLVILFGTLIAVLLAWIIGFLSLRRGGIYFAILTLTFGQMAFYLSSSPLAFLTNGENGFTSVSIAPLFGVLDLHGSLGGPLAMLPGNTLYLFVGAVTVLTIALANRILNSPYGIVFKAIRENESRAEFVGLDVWRYKLMAFIISALFAGISGSLFAIEGNYVPLSSLYWTTSGEVVIMTVLGGVGSLFGPLFGAAVYLYIEFIVSGMDVVGPFWHLILGLVFVVVVVLFPDGIWGGVTAIRDYIGGERR